MSEIYSLLIIFGFVFWVIFIVWSVIPALYGLPWIPSEMERIRLALKLAKLQPGENLYDLGSGDGRVLIAAAQEFQAVSCGVEIGPLHCLLAKYRAEQAGVAQRVSVRWGSFFNIDLSDADVVFIYGRAKQVTRLQPILEKQLKAGARVVSLAVDFPGWQPKTIDTEQAIFVYEMPPTPGSVNDWFMSKSQSL